MKLGRQFDDRYIVVPSGCWIWIGTLSDKGYGRYWINGREPYAHIYSYERNVGPVPDGLELDHLCRETRCVNWRHLEAVTHAENVRRGMVGKFENHHAKKTHCPRGHEFTVENTRIFMGTSRSNRGRHCRECQKRWNAARYAEAEEER